MNRLHAMTLIQRTVLESDCIDASDIFMRLRRDIPNGGDSELMSRKEIEAFAKQAIELRDQAKFPVERKRLELDITEGELRADVIDALALIDLSNPRDVRDVYEMHRKIGGSIGEPSLREAVDYLGEAGVDEAVVAPLAARLLALYPVEED